MEILPKGGKLQLDIVSKQETGSSKYYFGAGWDNPNGPVDLDLVAAALTGGKLAKDDNFTYYDQKKTPGVLLSKDNTTGDGDGDDESIVIDTGALADDIDGIAIGLICYSADHDFSNAPNPHFRVVDGDQESGEQMGDVQPGSGAASDTVLVGFMLTKGDSGWNLEVIGDFHAKGSETDAIKGFAELYS